MNNSEITEVSVDLSVGVLTAKFRDGKVSQFNLQCGRFMDYVMQNYPEVGFHQIPFEECFRRYHELPPIECGNCSGSAHFSEFTEMRSGQELCPECVRKLESGEMVAPNMCSDCKDLFPPEELREVGEEIVCVFCRRATLRRLRELAMTEEEKAAEKAREAEQYRRFREAKTLNEMFDVLSNGNGAEAANEFISNLKKMKRDGLKSMSMDIPSNPSSSN